MKNIYRTNGQYLGFLDGQNIFSWDGNYLGFVDEDKYVWSRSGSFCGQLTEVGGNLYVIKNIYTISPVSKSPRPIPEKPKIPAPSLPIPPVSLPIGFVDGF